MDMAEVYNTDLPNPLTLEAELDCWFNKWSLWEGDLPASAQCTLLFPNINNFVYTSCHNQ